MRYLVAASPSVKVAITKTWLSKSCNFPLVMLGKHSLAILGERLNTDTPPPPVRNHFALSTVGWDEIFFCVY